MRKYDAELFEKPRWLVLNKVDLVDESERAQRIADFLATYGEVERHFEISALKGEGCKALTFAIQDHLDAQRARIAAEAEAIAQANAAAAQAHDTEADNEESSTPEER